jgi:hypothetical protein
MRSILPALCLPLLVVLSLTAQAAQAEKWSQASYVWDSEALLDPGQRPAELDALRNAGMDKIYLGLKAAQIKDLGTTRQRLEQLLRDAAGKGYRSACCWATRAGSSCRNAISSPICWRNSRGFAFSSLHLDLEVEQLGMPVPDQRLKDWLETLRVASSVSPWPVEISSHHRWFADPKPDKPACPVRFPMRECGRSA